MCHESQDDRHHLYFLPIGGTAMAPLAGLLQLAGHRVEGVDVELYPPMSTLLEHLGIPVRLGWSPDAIPDGVDRVVIGNAVGRDNPEVRAVLDRAIPHTSQAEAVGEYVVGGRRSLVFAGTHGKTTTTAMAAWILEQAGADPSYLVGGMLPWTKSSFRSGAGEVVAIEGDEYNTAFWDRGPKFLHYRPWAFVLGPVEFDHGDIYPDLDAVLAAFRAGVALVPDDGWAIVNGWDETARQLGEAAGDRRIVVGEAAAADLRVTELEPTPQGTAARLTLRGRSARTVLPMPGHHNFQNAALAVAATVLAGIPLESAAAALESFPGVGLRMDEVGTAAGVTVVRDFAHHPTALGATVSAARQRWPGRRLVVAYEPRSISAGHRRFTEAYRRGFAAADVVALAPIYHRDRIPPADLLDREALVRSLAHDGVEAFAVPHGETTADHLLPRLRDGDVVVACSSGSFGGLTSVLLERIGAAAVG